MMRLVEIFHELGRRRVRYLIAGGVAATLYGNPRFTKDLDLLVDLEEKNLARLVKTMKALGLVPRVPVKPEDLISSDNRSKWIKEKGMKAFTFINPKDPFESVDILILSPLPFKAAFRKKKYFKFEGVGVPVVSAEDLILMKKKAGRDQDLKDIAILKEALKIEGEGK